MKRKATPRVKPSARPLSVRSGPKDPEIFIGLVGAVGADLEVVCRALDRNLTRVHYSCKLIHVIESIHEFRRWKTLPEEPLEARYTSHIQAGDQFREAFELADALARLSIVIIREKYRKPSSANKADADEPISRCAYILRSLKHPREVKLLRDVYGPNFFLLAAYSPHDARLKEFTRRIAASHHSAGQGTAKYGPAAAGILELDQAEPDKPFGQNLRETFPLADLFINVTNKDTVNTDVGRFVDLLFDNTEDINTPSRDEYGMFLARAAALRSSALGRQVGAAVSTERGDIIALGTNEVPTFEGGLYWPGPEDRLKHRVCACRDCRNWHCVLQCQCFYDYIRDCGLGDLGLHRLDGGTDRGRANRLGCYRGRGWHGTLSVVLLPSRYADALYEFGHPELSNPIRIRGGRRLENQWLLRAVYGRHDAVLLHPSPHGGTKQSVQWRMVYRPNAPDWLDSDRIGLGDRFLGW
jgi:deoxycytidylate deaminase